MKKITVLAAGFLLLALCVAWWQTDRQPQPVALTPTLTGQTEYCLTCHADVPDISPSHPNKVFGCVLCHGGERLALNASLAHSTLRGGANPSDLSVVEQSCGGGDCHSGSKTDGRDHIQRVMTSIQTTYAGAIASIRFTFGAQSRLSAEMGIQAVSDPHTQTGITSLSAFDYTSESHPFIQKFGENCLTCHLNAAPRQGEAYARFTGCAACHSPALPYAHNHPESKQIHVLTTAIPYTQCNTCHNRGNYNLRTMTFDERTDRPTSRLEDYYQPISQFTQCEYTLDCVDCHTRTEAMGDGDIHPNQKSIEYVRCQTCHGTPTSLPRTKTLTDPNDLAFKMAFLNPVIDLKLGDTILVTEKGEPLWNIRLLPDGTYEMYGKATRQYFTFRAVMGSNCTQDGQDQSSSYCHRCHAVKR